LSFFIVIIALYKLLQIGEIFPLHTLIILVSDLLLMGRVQQQ